MSATLAHNNHHIRPKTRYKRRGLLAAIAAAASLALIPASASAQTLYDVALNTHPSEYSMVLDVANASRAVGAPVIQWYSNGGANQRWDLVPDHNGYEHIVNVNSQLCLATNGAAGNWITQWPCSDSTQEDWTGGPAKYGSISQGDLHNPASGLYLNVNGGSSVAGAHLIAWYKNTVWDFLAEGLEYTQY
jgi:Ricin-type beta-trefoil lectin domain-like